MSMVFPESNTGGKGAAAVRLFTGKIVGEWVLVLFPDFLTGCAGTLTTVDALKPRATNRVVLST